MSDFKINGLGSADKLLAGIRITTIQHEKLKKLANENSITMQEVVRQMVDHCLKEMEKTNP